MSLLNHKLGTHECSGTSCMCVYVYNYVFFDDVLLSSIQVSMFRPGVPESSWYKKKLVDTEEDISYTKSYCQSLYCLFLLFDCQWGSEICSTLDGASSSPRKRDPSVFLPVGNMHENWDRVYLDYSKPECLGCSGFIWYDIHYENVIWSDADKLAIVERLSLFMHFVSNIHFLNGSESMCDETVCLELVDWSFVHI